MMDGDGRQISDDASGNGIGLPGHLAHLPERERAQNLELRRLFAEQEHGLRQSYADWLLWLLGSQFFIADAVFLAFAWVGRSGICHRE